MDTESSSNITMTSINEVKCRIMELDNKFDDLKNSVRECLERRGILVKRVADVLTSLSADEDEHHKMFLESHVSVLFKASDHSELFGTMNFHWNYLNCPLLDHIVRKLSLDEVRLQMETYKLSLQQFRIKTPLKLFCQSQRRRHVEPLPNFQKLVAKFKWPVNMSLEHVEQFRQEYASRYNLHECAMMVANFHFGSIVIIWFIPELIVETLRRNVPEDLLINYGVTTLIVAETSVFRSDSPPEVSVPSYILMFQLNSYRHVGEFVWDGLIVIINPRRTCAARVTAVNPRRAFPVRVTVVGFPVCLCVLSDNSLQERLFVLKTLSRTQRATKVKVWNE